MSETWEKVRALGSPGMEMVALLLVEELVLNGALRDTTARAPLEDALDVAWQALRDEGVWDDYLPLIMPGNPITETLLDDNDPDFQRLVGRSHDLLLEIASWSFPERAVDAMVGDYGLPVNSLVSLVLEDGLASAERVGALADQIDPATATRASARALWASLP